MLIFPRQPFPPARIAPPQPPLPSPRPPPKAAARPRGLGQRRGEPTWTKPRALHGGGRASQEDANALGARSRARYHVACFVSGVTPALPLSAPVAPPGHQLGLAEQLRRAQRVGQRYIRARWRPLRFVPPLLLQRSALGSEG